MNLDMTTGITDPDRPGLFLVAPWPTCATFTEVAGHFGRFHLYGDQSTTRLLAYYEGFVAALKAAPTPPPVDEVSKRWRADMLRSADRCATLFRDKYTVEAQVLPPAEIQGHTPVSAGKAS